MTAKAFEFGNFRVDADERTLLEGGHPVALTPKAFDTLLLLVENAGRLMEKEAMMERLWPGTFVEEANLANNISLLRKALGEQANRIQTVPRRGYRFTGEVSAVGDDAVVVEPKRRWWPIAAIAVGVIVALAAGILIGRAISRREPPTFRQVTFRRGIITNARFESDGETIIYSASHEDRPSELFVTRADQRTSRPLGVAGDLLAVSAHGDLAILTNAERIGPILRGTLARVPLTGGAPRELADHVQAADWSPDGNSLAVIRWAGPVTRVEYPLGHVLYQGASPLWFDSLRVSPTGDAIAFLLHESERFDDRGRAVVIDRSGRIIRSSRVFASTTGLAWSGDRLRIGAWIDDVKNGIYDVERSGRERAVTGSAGPLRVFDIASSGGALLVANDDQRTGIRALPPGAREERDLSWLDGSWIRDISADGRTLLFDEEGPGGGPTARVYTRTIDGAPAVDLGAGHAVAISPDGMWVLARQRFTNPPRFILLRTGAGEPKPVRTGTIETTERADWLPDRHRFLFIGKERGRPLRTYVYDIDTDRVAPVTPEGVTGSVATADGASVIAHRRGGAWWLYPLDGSAPRPMPSIAAGEMPQRFTTDALLTSTETAIRRVDLSNGAATIVRSLGTTKPPGCIYVSPPRVSADGRAYAYTYWTMSSQLYVVDGAQ